MKRSFVIVVLLVLLLMVGGVSAITATIQANQDGQLSQNSASGTWQTYRDAAGSTAATNSTNPYLIFITAHASTSNNYLRMYRYPINFTKPNLGAGYTITGAKLRLKYSSKVVTLIGQNETALVVGTPAGGVYAAGDYNNLDLATPTEIATRVDFTNSAAGSDVNFTFNAAGLTALEGAGYITLYALDGDEIDNAFSGTWSASTARSLRILGVSDATLSSRPYLEYTYTVSGDATPPDAISNLVNETPTSTSIKFNWNVSPSPDVSYVGILKNGTWANETGAATTTTWTGLPSSTVMFFNSTTVDTSGNQNLTHWQNLSATTAAPAPSGSFFTVFTASNDGDIVQSINGTWDEMWNGAGVSVHSNPTRANVQLVSSDTLDAYDSFYRGVVGGFDTSTLPDSAIVDSVTLDIPGYGKSNGFDIAPDFGITLFSPRTNGAFVAGDYDTFESTRLATDIPYASLNTGGTYGGNVYTFNTDGNNAVNVTGWTNLMIRTSWDIDNFEPIWANQKTANFNFYTSGTPAKTPVLNVTYHINADPPQSDFVANVTHDRSALPVKFTDLTTRFPDTWRWSYKNATTGWTVFSTLQNPEFLFAAGVYDVNLTTTNGFGSNTTTKTSYIESISSYPISSFAGTPTSGSRPLTVSFTDTSDAVGSSAWLWNFGDGNATSNTLQNPTHLYLTSGIYTVSLQVTNATGSDTHTETRYITVSEPALNHPIINNPLLSPGNAHVASEPWLSARVAILSSANTGKTRNYYTYGGSIATCAIYARDMATIYQLTGDTTYANKANEMLVNTARIYNATPRTSANESYEFVGDLAIAYDYIYQTKGVNSTFDDANKTTILYQSAWVTDKAYSYMYLGDPRGWNSLVQVADRHGKTYPKIAIAGEVWRDYVSPFPNGTTTQWANLGSTGLFTNDTLHVQPNRGLLSYTWNLSSGRSHLGAYKYYIDNSLYRWFNIYSNIHGSIFTDYPASQAIAMEESWEYLPNHWVSDYNTDGQARRYTGEMIYRLLDVTNRSFLRWQLDANKAAPKLSAATPEVLGQITSSWDMFMFYDDYSSESYVQPTNPNSLSYTGAMQIVRENWGETSDWISFITWDQSPPTNSLRSGGHNDQMTFEYSSKGDLLMPDGGEPKHVAMGIDPAWTVGLLYGFGSQFHNSFIFNDFDAPYSTIAISNTSYRGMSKAAYTTSAQREATVSSIIETPSLSYIGADVNIDAEESSYPGTAMAVPIKYKREILYPTNDYMVVLDRATSANQWNYSLVYRFGSYGIVESTGTTMATIGHVNGTLSTDSTQRDWLTPTYLTWQDGGVTNSIYWNTTNKANDPVRLEVFTAPESTVTIQKMLTRIAGYASANEVFAPIIHADHPMSNTMFSVTALLSRYANETPRTPSELTVTGTGSAINILSADGTKTDTIYTGTGNSTLSNGINTDADTAFARKVGSGFSDFTTINGTHLYDGSVSLFNSSTRLTYLSANMSATGAYSVAVSGTAGAATLKFYNITSNPTYVLIDGVEPSWSRSGTTLTIITPLSDHTITFDGGAGYSTSVPPVASFTPTGTTTGTVPFSVSFTDASSNAPTTWAWTFGDGNVTENTLQNPVHLYTAAGNYSVSLTATNVYGSDVSDQVTWVNASALASPAANFTATPLSGQAPLLVTFTDSSTNTPTGWVWDYSNATTAWTQFSTLKNPTITLPEGVYNFRLNASNSYGFDVKTRSGGYITATQAFPCSVNYASYQDHWAKCSGLDYIEMWNNTGTFNAPTWVTNVSYYLRGAGAGGNGYGAEAAQNGWGGYAGSTASGYNPVTGGTAYTVALGSPGNTGTNGLNGCPTGSTSGGATTFHGLSAAGGVGARFNPTSSYCELIYNTGWQGAAGDPDLNYGGGGDGGKCVGIGCASPTFGTSGKKGIATLTYHTTSPVASFTPIGENNIFDTSIVQFTDTSTNTPDAWVWSYTPEAGLKTTFAITKNPQYMFGAGNYNISLNASNSMGYSDSSQITWINVTAAPTNPNPGAVIQMSTIPAISNLTKQTVVVSMQNINITNNVSVDITFPRLPLYIVSVSPNTSTWANNVFTRMEVNNATGTIHINTTRPSGYVGNGNLADITILYQNYTLPFNPLPVDRMATSNALLKNATSGIDYPVLTPSDTAINYADWTTYSNFTVSNTNPLANQTTVHFVPEMNFTATEWLWDYGDGTTETRLDGLGSHMYSAPGFRDVNLTARLIANTSVTNTTSLHYALNVSYDPAYVKSNFVGYPLTGTPGTLVTFTDLSEFGTGATTSGRTYNWSFGDGWYSPMPYSSNVGGATHVYTANGIYSINLTVNNTLGGDYEFKTNYITISNSQQQTTWYTPSNVRFKFYDTNLNALSGLSVTATPLNFTAPDDWANTLIGVNPGVNILGTAVTGITSTDGSWVAPMLQSLQYQIHVTGSSIDYTFTLFPSQNEYVFTIPVGLVPIPTSAANIVTYTLGNATVDATHQYINMTYHDASVQGTNYLKFQIQSTNGTIVYEQIYLGALANQQSYNQLLAVSQGQSYTYSIMANQSEYGWINQTQTLQLANLVALVGDSPSWVEEWFAIGLIIIFTALFSIYSKAIGMIALPLLTWFFQFVMGWLPSTFLSTTTLGVMLALGILIYIRQRESMIT